MNKASAKEPSMDEILSSIRQIIADDDAGITPAAPPIGAEPGAAPEQAPEPDPIPDPEPAPALEVEPEPAPELAPELAPEPAAEAAAVPEQPLSLSPEQIVEDEPEPIALAEDDLAEAAEALLDDDEPIVPEMVEPDDISFEDNSMDAVEPVIEVAEPTPEPVPVEPAMPDPDLASDIADKLLEPATGEAVKATFSKLSNVALGTQSLTIENMIREMLRPMLKDWLDENLPSVVEKMVESEIERISRGG